MKAANYIKRIFIALLLFFIFVFILIAATYYINLSIDARLPFLDSEFYYSLGAILIFALISLLYLKNIYLIILLAIGALPLYFFAAFISLCSSFKNCL